jgi:hypothetical protein
MACLILYSIIFWQHPSWAAGVADLKSNFVAQLNAVITSYEESRPDIDNIYKRDLHGIQIKSMEDGRRALVAAVRAELERFLIERHVPQEISEQTPESIAELQRAYYRRLIDLLNKRDLEILGVADACESGLKKLRAGLTGASASEIDNEIRRIGDNPHVAEARLHVVFVSKRRQEPKPEIPRADSRPLRIRPVVDDDDSALESVAVFIRSQSDARTREQYYVGRWVWIAEERRWQREILSFNRAPRPARDHKLWDYVRGMSEPKNPGLRPWDNYGYKRFAL